MKKNYYDASTLEYLLGIFEERYGMTSAAFYAAHLANETLEGIPGFERHVWASFYRDVKRLRGGFAEHAERLLTPA